MYGVFRGEELNPITRTGNFVRIGRAGLVFTLRGQTIIFWLVLGL